SHDPQCHLRQRDEDGECCGELARERRRPHDERAHERQHDEHIGQHHRTATKTTTRTATVVAITRTYERRRPLCSRAVPSATSVTPAPNSPSGRCRIGCATTV